MDSGAYAGALTSPVLDAAIEAAGTQEPAVGYALAYPVGVAVAIIIRDQDGRPTGLGPALEMPRASGAGTSGLSWCAPNAVCVLATAGTEGGGVPEVRLV